MRRIPGSCGRQNAPSRASSPYAPRCWKPHHVQHRGSSASSDSSAQAARSLRWASRAQSRGCCGCRHHANCRLIDRRHPQHRDSRVPSRVREPIHIEFCSYLGTRRHGGSATSLDIDQLRQAPRARGGAPRGGGRQNRAHRVASSRPHSAWQSGQSSAHGALWHGLPSALLRAPRSSHD